MHLKVAAYWLSRFHGESLPGRPDIDPVDFPPGALPHVLLTDVIDRNHGQIQGGGASALPDRKFRIRLIGSGVREHTGADVTGRYLSDLHADGDYLTYLSGINQMICDTRCAVASATRYYRTGSDITLDTVRLSMPLATDGIVPDMVLTVQISHRNHAAGDGPTLVSHDLFEDLGVISIPTHELKEIVKSFANTD